MTRLLNIEGMKYGRLTVSNRAPNHPNYGQARWNCKCDCGNDVIQYGFLLYSGKIKSCGCLLKENQKSGFRLSHGMSHTPEHNSWISMQGRCYNKNNEAYHLYGGRGIKVCDRWLQSFDNFYDDMGKRPSVKHSLDRWPDMDGNYEPRNCRWATKIEQARNRNTTVFVVFNGESIPLQEAAEKLGIDYRTMWHRYKIGKREDMLFAPLRIISRRKK